MSELKWYVLKAVSGQENKVKNYIENEIQRFKLEDFVSQIVIPMEKTIQMRNGKKVQKEKPYYPGYLMVEANLTGEVPHIIKNIPGVISFLSLTKGGDPVPMRKSEVNRMLGRMDELSQFATDVDIPYVVGESVKVIDGPFNGFNGTIEKIHEDKKKLEVMVLIFGRKTPLELNYMQVEKI
ncbi:transcription termination/antitermination factor NusG [Riemerella anatipestifer]|uniref:transcription termination/antitermination protein NusG n=1 Tax=Riemerella anatipestifer TaxID=34085 RepID=UPI001AD7C911|nr:transcription termination/antitermination protein NusG [Riemerella anatipestifer]MBO4233753.1 transcription termination/antitermination factor NusG [Riemerella anatipestifer]